MVTNNAINMPYGYAEGTFTPTLVGSTPGTTTYTGQNGYYTRIGNTVFVQANIVITAATGTGDMILGALPFTIKNQSQGYTTGAVFWQGSAAWTWPTGGTNLALLGIYNSTTAVVWAGGTAVAGGFMQMANGALQIAYSMTYQV